MPLMTAQAYQALPPVTADRRVAYGTHPAQFADLYLPVGPGPHPAVVLIHGGCWRAQYGLEPLGPLCAALRDLGLAVWSIEYRRLGDGGGWPTTFQDVAAAADAMSAIAADSSIDLSQVIAAGHSAGGQLALWLAARSGLPNHSPLYQSHPLALRGVLALAGLADLATAAARGLCSGACVELLGGTPDVVPERYAQVSPAAMLPLSAPQQHLVGSEDRTVPVDYLRDYVARAAASGPVLLELIADAGHFELVDPSSHAWPAVRRAMSELLLSQGNKV